MAAAAAARPPPLKLLGARIEAGVHQLQVALFIAHRRLAERAAKAAAKPPSFGRPPSDQSTFEELQADFAKEAAAIDAIVFGEPSDPAIAAAAARAVDNPYASPHGGDANAAADAAADAAASDDAACVLRAMRRLHAAVACLGCGAIPAAPPVAPPPASPAAAATAARVQRPAAAPSLDLLEGDELWGLLPPPELTATGGAAAGDLLAVEPAAAAAAAAAGGWGGTARAEIASGDLGGGDGLVSALRLVWGELSLLSEGGSALLRAEYSHLDLRATEVEKGRARAMPPRRRRPRDLLSLTLDPGEEVAEWTPVSSMARDSDPIERVRRWVFDVPWATDEPPPLRMWSPEDEEEEGSSDEEGEGVPAEEGGGEEGAAAARRRPTATATATRRRCLRRRRRRRRRR